MIVSADGIATSTAEKLSSAAKQSLMIPSLTSGRTASWKSTLLCGSRMTSSARRVVPLRVSAPSRMWVTLWYSPVSTMARTASRCPGAIITTISSTSGCRFIVARVCSRIVRPAILISCLGMSRPDAGSDTAREDHCNIGAHR